MTREELINEIARHMGMEDPSEFWIDCAKAAIATIEASGLVIVPVEITEEMMSIDHSKGTWQDVWNRLLSASPLKP